MLETLLVVIAAVFNLHSTFPLAGVGVVVQCHKLPLLVRLIPEQLVIAILLSSPPFWRPGLAHPLPHKKLVKKAGTGHWEEKHCEKTSTRLRGEKQVPDTARVKKSWYWTM